ncbi:hypothetical protein DV735_g4803, partial [Chaetothyriales sp. CBS 134920]
MTGVDTVCLWVGWSSLALLTLSHETSIAYDRPLHTFVAALGLAAFVLVGVARSKSIPALFVTSPARDAISSLPLNDGAKIPLDNARRQRYHARLRLPLLATATAAITARLEVHRQVSKATECMVSSVEVWLPLLLFVYDCVRTQRHHYLDSPSQDTAGLSARLKLVINRYVLRSRYRYLAPIAAVSLGCSILLSLWRPLNSTYICPITGRWQHWIPLLQICGLALDCGLAVLVYETITGADNPAASSGRSVELWGRSVELWSTAMFVSASLWATVGAVLYLLKPEWRRWLLLLDTPSFLDTSIAVFLQAILLSILAVSALHAIVVFGVLHLALTLTVVATLLPLTAFLWAFPDPFPPAPIVSLAFGISLIYLGWWTFHQINHALDPREPGPARPGLKLLVAVILIAPACFKQSSLRSHPIDFLLSEAEQSHQAYLRATELDLSLAQVVSRYKNRYGRTPPPGFDIWWEYATNRSTLILDEYDQIYEDLLPFWAVPPAEIRRQTGEMISNSWNEISGISIREGVAIVQENVLPTHRWMLEGVAVLINAFARYLPDMDLAFNLNDESRVAVPYNQLQSLRRQGEATKSFGTESWSPNRADGWQPATKEPGGDTVFRNLAFHNTFDQFGSVGCPPWSASRARSHIASQSSFCYSCAAPHTVGQFLSNWTLAADVCHQPDLAHLHGFYLSPAAFKAAHSLQPVFSQSKPHAYNDILYPSAWNYMDKVLYAPSEPIGKQGEADYKPGFPDPPFSEKARTLFWRGATSEGVSSGDHTWRGMARQRLIHLANNLTAHPHDDLTLLLPAAGPSMQADTAFTYTTVPSSSASSLGLSIDARVVDHISRCGLRDCPDQEAEFSPASVAIAEFQAHWQYKYLFDLDGAGFSGRFLPFLQSRSLPFKTALFREWYDSRLTAWKHFVPVDLRLHGVWSTLAYFAGVDGWIPSCAGGWWPGKRRVVWPPHDREAESIALAGREWSSRVLRKEDMEVYFFRLLLEWARITDDERMNLGFDVDIAVAADSK